MANLITLKGEVKPRKLKVDNKSAIALSKNLVYHESFNIG